MKKLAMILLTGLMFYTASSQTTPTFGVKGGLNIASLKVESGDVNSKLGLHAGLLAHIHLSRNIGLQPEIVYSGQGMEQTTGGEKFTWNLNYINVPVMLQYMFSNGFRLEAGPQIGFLMSGKIKDPSGSTDVKDVLKKTDIGIGFGLNYLTYSGFGFGGRYNLGLTDINDVSDYSIKNRVGQISIFYMFQHNHKAASK